MFLDLTVVYFAFGAPLGVYEITRNERSPRTAVLAAVHFVLWPLFAAASLRRSFTVPIRERSLEEKIDELRIEFEAVAFDTAHSIEVLEFRDTYARYTGLALAVNRAQGGKVNDLFTVAAHNDRTLASRCLERRNRRRLEFHLLQARNKFDDTISKLTDRNVDQLAGQLAGLLKEAAKH